MQIAILSPVYPFRGGIAHHTTALTKQLKNRGHNIKIFSFRRQFPSFLFPGKTQMDTSNSPNRIDSLRIFTPWNPVSWIRTAITVMNNRPNLLLLVWWTPFTAPGYWVICALCRKIPKLFLLHNVIPHEPIPGMKLLSRAVFRWADGFIVQSKKVEGELNNILTRKHNKWMRLTPHPRYDFHSYSHPDQQTARQKLGINEKYVLLFFGIVRKYKGLMTLLRAFPAILQRLSGNVRLIIAGEFYDDPRPYLSAISNSGCAEKITIENRYIPNEEMGIYFSAADVVVLPYESASQSGITQTAFGFGKPVISTQVGGLPETINPAKTGLLCRPNDPEKLAEAVIEFYRLSKTVDWKTNIENESERFSWDNMAAAVEEFWEEIRVIR